MQKPYNTNLLILMEIIHPNQIAILLFCYILENIILLH
jgi:hypothetical protein